MFFFVFSDLSSRKMTKKELQICHVISFDKIALQRKIIAMIPLHSMFQSLPMSGKLCLASCIDPDGSIDVSKFFKYRKQRDASDDEDEIQEHKRRKYVKRNYEGYDPEAALNSEWYNRYLKESRHPKNKKHFKKFRRRFRMPFNSYKALVFEARSNNWFPEFEKCNALGQRGVPLDILILGSLRYLGRGWTFDDLHDATGVSEELHRVFFKAFCKACRKHLYPKWVKRPESAEEIADCMSEFVEAGLAPLTSHMLSLKSVMHV
jgi:hypothetical protein